MIHLFIIEQLSRNLGSWLYQFAAARIIFCLALGLEGNSGWQGGLLGRSAVSEQAQPYGQPRLLRAFHSADVWPPIVIDSQPSLAFAPWTGYLCGERISPYLQPEFVFVSACGAAVHTPLWRRQLVCSMPNKTSAGDAVWTLKECLAMAEIATAPQLHWTVQGIQIRLFSSFCSTQSFLLSFFYSFSIEGLKLEVFSFSKWNWMW